MLAVAAAGKGRRAPASELGAGLVAALLLWLPPALFHLITPFELRHIGASPVLQKLLLLALAAASAIGLVLAALSVLAVATLSRRRWRQDADGTMAPIDRDLSAVCILAGASAITVGCWRFAHTAADQAQWPAEAGLVALLVAASAAAVVPVVLVCSLAAGSRREVALLTAAVAAVGAWVGVMLWQFELGLGERATALVACSATALSVRLVARTRRLPADAVTATSATMAWKRAEGGALLAGILLPGLIVLMPRGGEHGDASLPPPSGDTNVVVVMIDTMRADHTTLAAYARDTTPTLTAAATGGRATSFSAAVAAGASTVPSVKALFTGRVPSAWGAAAGNRPPPPQAWTLAEAFRRGGYATAAFSANPLIEGAGFARGFEQFWSAGGYRFFLRSFLLNDLVSGDRTWEIFRRIARLRLHKIDGTVIRRLAMQWLEENGDRRFFLYLHLIDPHWPYHERGHGLMPEELVSLDDPYSHVDLQRLRFGSAENATIRGSERLRELIARYDEEVRHSDDVLAGVLADLAELGLARSTMVVVLGDHGEEFLEHNGFGHGHDVFQEQIWVPLVFLWPDEERFAAMPARIDRPVSLLDVLPTLTELLALPAAPADLDGHSLAPVLAAPDAARHGPVTSEAFLPGKIYAAYREGSLKARFRYDYALPPAHTQRVLVFDLDADPAETLPLDRAQPGVDAFVARGRALLQSRWQRAVDRASPDGEPTTQ